MAAFVPPGHGGRRREWILTNTCYSLFYFASKKMKKIDLHTHILPKNIPDLAKKYGYGSWVTLEHDQLVRNIREMMMWGN